MQRADPNQPADGLEPEPSTRRVSSGSPADPSSSADEPNFSRTDKSEAIFEDLKARISRLWDEGASAEDIRSALRDPGRS
jgi:hypothetical protein